MIEAYELNANADPFGEVFTSLNRILNGAAAVVHVITDVAVDVTVSLIPFVGDYRDFCEMISGRKYCLPQGEVLTSADRIFAGMGVILGSRIFWEGVTSVAGEFVFNYANLMAEISDAVLHGRRPLDSLRGLLDDLHGLPNGFQNLMSQSDTALKLPNGTYKPIDFVYLDEAFDAQRNFQFTFNPSNASGYPSNWDEVAEWTYIVEPGTHRVRIAPRGGAAHRQSHAQLAGSGTNVQAAEVRVLMAGKLHFDPVTRKLLRADTDSGHFKPDLYPENRAWIPDYMAGVMGAHGVDPRTPFRTFDKVMHVFK
ncbi:MAG: hypothetical protein HOK97_23670 [Deltaproteobacteria bacterium]|nr:hypothetical protein [Deltaproteobacteria bacterium]